LAVSGCGKVVMTATLADGLTNIVDGVISVGSGATLQLATPDVVLNGSGSIALDADSTLVLPLYEDGTYQTLDIVPVTLPSEGVATICIGGTSKLPFGEYELLGSVPEGYESQLAVSGAPVNGRSVTLFEEGSRLKMLLSPKALRLILR